ncbi:hypothetical protein B0A49_06602 [Cryomyces minteri]|uniref:Uncharacterized protein n=1 Tax=Cryomyces minteri TaxID=331657 RepID=A0A4U0X253_9PEZI|nr:hypothetical protein B0A49_06602 [Cryomyces minteri]
MLNRAIDDKGVDQEGLWPEGWVVRTWNEHTRRMNDAMARLACVSVARLASTDIYSPEATAIFQHDYDQWTIAPPLNLRNSAAHPQRILVMSSLPTPLYEFCHSHASDTRPCSCGRSRRLLALSNISPATTTPRIHTFIVDAARQDSEIDIVHIDHEPGSSEAVVVLGPFENAQMVLSAIRIRIRVDTHGEFASVRVEVLGEKDNKEEGVEMAIFYSQSTTKATEAVAKNERENAQE